MFHWIGSIVGHNEINNNKSATQLNDLFYLSFYFTCPGIPELYGWFMFNTHHQVYATLSKKVSLNLIWAQNP